MQQHAITRRTWLAAGLGLVGVAAAPSLALAQSAPGTANSVSGTLEPGGWVAYRFLYAGNNAPVALALRYGPLTTYGTVTGKAITLGVFSPLQLPPAGAAIGHGGLTKAPGVQYYQLSSPIGGGYVVVVHNFDTPGHQLSYTLTLTNVPTGTAGPALTLVSSSAGAGVTAPAAPTAATAIPSTAPMPTAVPSAPMGSSASGSLAPGGGSASYRFSYPGRNMPVGITLTYGPTNTYGSYTGSAILLDIYSPLQPPQGHHPLGSGGRTAHPGVKYYRLTSPVSGDYVIEVHNYDVLGHPIQYTLATASLPTGTAGPALTRIAGPQ